MKRYVRSIYFVFLIIVTPFICFATPATLDRSEIPDKYKWNFADFYPEWQAWEKDISILDKKMQLFISMKGTLTQGPEALLKALKLNDEMRILHSKINNYVQLQLIANAPVYDLNNKLQLLRGNTEKAIQSTIWFEPEILSIPKCEIDKWLTSNSNLTPYKMMINQIFHANEHILSEDKELLISKFNPLSKTVSSLYEQFVMNDMLYPSITLSTGESMELNHTTVFSIFNSETFTQEDRHKADTELNKLFKKNINILASFYAAGCERDWAFAHARNYSSCLEAELFDENIPTTVFENLIQTARAHTSVLQRYLSLKKNYIMKRKNLTKFRSYDRFINLFDFAKDYPYEIGKTMVFNAVAPLGKEYQSYTHRAYENRWFDVYNTIGKTPSNFTQMTYGYHPFANLSYEDHLENLFNLAHELGHVMDYFYSGKTQPYSTYNSPILTAETISQLNEQLLIYYLIENTPDPIERSVFLDKAISNIYESFWQTIFHSDFEYQAHQLAEKGNIITAESLIALEKQLNDVYFGDTRQFDAKYTGIEWSKEKNFFIKKPFLAYQYAIGFAASLQLYSDITKGSPAQREAAQKRYIELLKSGSSDYPIELLKRAGVDMTKPDAVLTVIAEMDRLVALLEKEVNKL